jgi:hypothetical protein
MLVQAFLFLLLMAAVAAAQDAAGLIEARLLTPVSSYRSKRGDKVEASVATRVCTAGG